MASLIRRARTKVHRKLSLKIGLSFLTVVIAIELGLFISLYLLMLNTHVRQEVNSVVTRGDNHARVLATAFDSEMIQHAIMTEADSNTAIVIQDSHDKILQSSQTLNNKMKQHIQSLEKVSTKSQALHYHLFGDDYIVSVSPIRQGDKLLGKVYMFLQTNSIRQTIFDFTTIFIVLALLSLLITIFAVLYISRRVTRPLVQIKDGTEKIAQGDLSLALNVKTGDELSELAQSIENLAHHLDSMKKERNEFLASVAHELRTPLTLVRGYADIAVRSNLTEPERANYLGIIREETARLTRLMEDLMTLAQLEENNFKIEKEPVAVAPFVAQLRAKAEGIFAQKNIRLECSGNFDFQAKLDPERIEQVLMNLLMNAYKYSPENSTITINTFADEKKFYFKIIDEGEGIPDSELAHIFDRFYRVDKSRTRKTGGVGLGLAIVKDIIKLHGGKIMVNSKIGLGTQFEISLPLE